MLDTLGVGIACHTDVSLPLFLMFHLCEHMTQKERSMTSSSHHVVLRIGRHVTRKHTYLGMVLCMDLMSSIYSDFLKIRNEDVLILRKLFNWENL